MTRDSLLAHIAALAFTNPRLPGSISSSGISVLREDMRRRPQIRRLAFEYAYEVAPRDARLTMDFLEAMGYTVPGFIPEPQVPTRADYNLDKYVDYDKCHIIPKFPSPELTQPTHKKDTTMNPLAPATTAQLTIPTDFDKATEWHEKALADIANQRVAAAEREAMIARIGAQQDLLNATRTLLGDLQELLVEGRTHADSRTLYAKHRKELAELAGEYGYKIVLVGDKTRATIVKM